MRSSISLALVALASLVSLGAPTAPAAQRKTSLLADDRLAAIAAEASGSLAFDTVVQLGTMHRVHGTAGFRAAADAIAAKARGYGLENVAVESFPADGKTTYGTFRAYYGWQAESALLEEVEPRRSIVADYSKLPVALADYSNGADVTAELVDVGDGTSDADYASREVRGKIVLAGGGVAAVHEAAVEKRGAAGILSYQPNQRTGWSGDYADNVRWGHLSPYNLENRFAFMTSLRAARTFRERLVRGERIRLHAKVDAAVRPATFDVVTATIPGTDKAAGEIVFSCHLCHQKPGANDNASGAATILEDARVLATLIRSGRLPRPRRTIRFVWPPEIAGTMCYLSRHPEVARAARAAIHMDMVGGSFASTKAIFHLTRTPASLPSFVDDVASVFGEYVVDGSKRAAASGDFADALLSPDGSKEMLVAEIAAPASMGSDHDVYQESSFRIPTIYMNDWPDVFIHTHNDTPANIDATKLRRVAVIGAAAGYFLASAGSEEAVALAGELFARGGTRQSDALRRAIALAAGGALAPPEDEEARNIVHQAAVRERLALEAIATLAPGDPHVRRTLDALIARVARREEEAVATLFEIVPVAAGQTSLDPTARVVPIRSPSAVGPMSVYYYDYLVDHGVADAPGDERMRYEALNLVDGRRSVKEIRDVLAAAYGPVSSDEILRIFEALERAGVVRLAR